MEKLKKDKGYLEEEAESTKSIDTNMEKFVNDVDVKVVVKFVLGFFEAIKQAKVIAHEVHFNEACRTKVVCNENILSNVDKDDEKDDDDD